MLHSEKQSWQTDKKTEEKIRKHYSDANDHITEEDISSVRTNFLTKSEVEETVLVKEQIILEK